jgi:hypothetical protein
MIEHIQLFKLINWLDRFQEGRIISQLQSICGRWAYSQILMQHNETEESSVPKK